MTYNVFGGTLNLANSTLTQWLWLSHLWLGLHCGRFKSSTDC